MATVEFLQAIKVARQEGYRDMPWRHTEGLDGYHILVSEMMLQQTQVQRVIPKYVAFMRQFPDIHSLANAPLAEVLRSWNGLGYNRRAKYLHDAAKTLKKCTEPWNYEQLVGCKGIGPNTAKAVLVYAYNQTHLFVETNVRTVFVHYFFHDMTNVSDVEIEERLCEYIDSSSPRTWYWAVMDEGARLKASGQSHLHKIKSHKKQSPFEGSDRQIRGRVIKLLTAKDAVHLNELYKLIDDERTELVIKHLENEGLVHISGDKASLSH